MTQQMKIPRQWDDVTIMQKMALWQAPLIFILSLEIGVMMWGFWAASWLMSSIKRWWLQAPILAALIAITAQLVPIKSADFFILMLVILLPFTWRLEEPEMANDSGVSPAGLCPTIFLAGSVFIFQTQFIILLALVAWLLSFLLWFTTALTGFRLTDISVRWVPIIAGSMATAALIVALFAFIPRLGTGFIPSFATASQKIGLTDTLSPGGMSDLLASQEVAFRAIPRVSSQPAPRYWRVFALTQQKGADWQRAGDTSLQNDFTLRGTDTQVSYQILTDTHDLEVVPMPGWPGSSAEAVAFGYGYNRYGEALLGRGRDTRQVIVTARHSTTHRYDYPASDELSGANPRLQALARDLRQDYPDEEDFINALMARFATDFLYDTKVSYPTKDALDAFYFEGKIGYCSYFATALATMLRAGGLEAHVITGYMGGDWNTYGNYWLVKQSDAHAWVEVKRADGTWQRLDPTLAVMQLSSARFSGLASFGQTELDGRTLTPQTQQGFWARFAQAVAFADSLNVRVTLAIMNYGDDTSDATGPAASEDNFALLLAAMGLAVTILFVLIAVMRLSALRGQGRPYRERQLEKLIARHSSLRAQGESLIEHAQKLAVIDAKIADKAQLIAAHIYQMRFANRGYDEAFERQIGFDIKALSEALKQARKAVKASPPLRR